MIDRPLHKARTLAALLVLLPPMPAFAAQPTIEAGKAYLQAYQALDEVGLASLYAEHARFVDPTSRVFPDGGFNAQGRDAVIQLIRRLKAQHGLESLEYVADLTFHTEREAVLAGRLRSRVRDKRGVRIYETPVVTILTIEGGLVVEHRDYADYAAGREVAR